MLMSAAMVVGISACSASRTGSDVADEGSVLGSAQPAAVDSEDPEEPELPEEPEIPEYDPIDLDFDNPLADAEIASVEFRLYGVGEQELEGTDKQTVLDIAQSDARVFMSYYDEGPGYAMDENGKTSAGPRFVATLESGEELVLEALLGDTGIAIFYINNYCYELSVEEYESFAAVYDRCYEDMLEGAKGKIKPFAELTADDLIKITRVNYYSFSYEDEYPLPEQVLTEEQAETVIATLNGLEIDPATADPKLDMLFGGGYAKFELWFKDGSHYLVGAINKTLFNDDATEILGSVSTAFIDHVLYECNEDFVNDLYWDYEETDPDYVRWYLSAREVPEYPFEELTAEEIAYAEIELEDDSLGWTTGIVPRLMADEIVDALKGIRYTDDNKVDVDSSSPLESSEMPMTLHLASGEYIMLGVDGDEVVLNFEHYAQEPEVIEALESLISDVRDAYADLIDSSEPWTEVAVKGSDGSSDYDPKTGTLTPVTEYIFFDLPSLLVEHEDGYYPKGYTLEDAPLSVRINSYDRIGGDSSSSLSAALEEQMDASDGSGFYKGQASNGKEGKGIIVHWGEDGQDTEIVVSGGSLTCVEVYIKGSDDFEVTPEAVYMLVVGSMNTQRIAQ